MEQPTKYTWTIHNDVYNDLQPPKTLQHEYHLMLGW